MNTTTILFYVIGLYCLGSIYFVFKLRGQERYYDFSEYLRKGWFIFAPFNSFLYIFTKKRAAKPIMNVGDFPELKVIQDNWETIKEEAQALRDNGYFEQTSSEDSGAYYDLGFRTFIKYGWSKFYVHWYGYDHKSAKDLCPKTQEILKKVPSVNGSMFSYLPAGSQLTRHLDPIASSLRLHVSLDTPNSEDAFINVDGKSYSWKDGDSFLFDETYIHYAQNNTDKDRLILMCDVERPMGLPGKIVNIIAKQFLKFSVVPNLEGDRRGLVNFIFSNVTPLMQKIRTLKQTNLFLYKLIKYAVNISLLILIIFLTKTVIDFIGYLLK